MNSWYAGRHWSFRAKVASEYHWAVKVALKGKRMRITGYPVRIVLVFKYKGRLPDVDNCPAKLIIDGLKLCGVIEDDSPKFVNKIEVSVEKGGDEVDVEIV